jgi:hypothetical protein
VVRAVEGKGKTQSLGDLEQEGGGMQEEREGAERSRGF